MLFRSPAGVPASAIDVEAAKANPERARAGEGGVGRGGFAPPSVPPPPGSGINGDNFSRPSDVTWDRAGNIYVAERDNHVIRRIDRRTGLISTAAGTAHGFTRASSNPAAAANPSMGRYMRRSAVEIGRASCRERVCLLV